MWFLPDSSNPNPLCIVKMMKAEMMIHIASASGDSPPVKGLFIAVLDSPPVKGLFVVMLPLTDIMRYIKQVTYEGIMKEYRVARFCSGMKLSNYVRKAR